MYRVGREIEQGDAMWGVKAAGLGTLVVLALAGTPAQAAQTPATKRLEADRKKLYAESRKADAEHNKLIGGIIHGTERIAKDETKIAIDQSEVKKAESEVEEERGAPHLARLEHLQMFEKKCAAKLADAEQKLALDRLGAESAQLHAEAELAVLRAETEALEEQIVADEVAVAEGG